jgi:translocation and assembly module TamB
MGWIAVGFGVLLIALLVGGYFYLQTAAFQRFALPKIEQEADAATGGQAQIGGLVLYLRTLTVTLNNITLRGTEAPSEPPLFHADSLAVRVRILPILGGKFSLRELKVAHPVAHVQVSREGKSNLPSPPPSKSRTSVFDLAIGHAQLTHGEIDYNDRKIPLYADLYDLGADVHFIRADKTYAGEVSYRRGQLRYAQYAPLPHDLDARFSVSPDEFVLQSALLKVGESSVRVTAHLTNYSHPVAEANYEILLHTQNFAAMAAGTRPAGDVSLTGKLRYQSSDEPLLRNVSLNGQLASNALSAVTSDGRIELQRLRGTYQLASGNLQLTDLNLDTLGGHIAATAEMNHLDATPDSRLQATLRGISLRSLQQMQSKQSFRAANISGAVNGTTEAEWKGGFSNLRAQADLTVRATATPAEKTNAAGTEVPVNGAIHASYDGTHQTLALRQTYLKIPSAAVNAQGVISDHSNLQLVVNAGELRPLAELAAAFQSSTTNLPAISGGATLQATVQGSLKKPNIAGTLSAHNLAVGGSRWKSVRFRLQAGSSRISISDGLLVNAEQGRASFSAAVKLNNWAYQPSNSLQATVNAQRLRLADLRELARQNFPIAGDLSATISISGSELNPSGSGTVQIANANAYGEPIQKLAARFQASHGTIVSTLNASAPAGTLDADLSYTPRTKAYKVQVHASSIVLQKLQTLKERNLGVTATVNVSAKGEGTLDNPQLTAELQLPQLAVRQKSISGVKADVQIANHAANVGFGAEVAQAPVRGQAQIALTGDYYAEATIDTGAVPLDVLMATYAGGVPQGFSGQTELHASMKGPLKDKGQIVAELSIPVLKASYQSLQIGITKPIRADYANSVIALQPAEIQGTGTELRVQGQIPIAGTGVPTLTAQGTVDARIARIVDPDLQSSGALALDVHATGSAKNPSLEGQIQVKDVAFTTSTAPVGVSKLNGTIEIANDRLQLSRLMGQVGGGNVSLGGSIIYRPSLQFNLAMQAQDVRLLYPEGLRSGLSANLAFSGNMRASVLNGRVLINNLAFTPDFDLTNFASQFGGATITPAQPGLADTVKLAIVVQSAQNLSATSSQLSIAGNVALQVEGTAANPVITGRTNLTSGEVFYRAVRYRLQTGVIVFNDPNQTRPNLNISVTATVEQYNLTINLRGPLDRLTTTYNSDPPLATADIINLLAQGQTTQEAAAAGTSTDSIIASQAASQLTSTVQKLAGISSLEIDPTIGGGQNPSARVAIQQRITKNLLFTFSTDVSLPGSEIVQGEYQINKHWSVSAQRDQVGGISMDARYHTRF